MSGTYFDVFDLPRRYGLDKGELEQRYRERSKHWHPDRFSRAPASERAAVLARATELNEAYRVLKSDTRRAEYLLKLRGIDVTKEGPGSELSVDLDFLSSILELREELVEARIEKDGERLVRLSALVSDELEQSRARLSAGFARVEAGDDEALAGLTETILAQRYYQRFQEDIAAYEEAQAEAAGLLPP